MTTPASNPVVSVIVPNYNHAPYLKQRLESIFEQSYNHFEVIILDDCSIDNSRAVIETYRHHPKVSQVVYNETNSGSTFRQWQKGIALARGKWIWIAESDDLCEPDFLEQLMQDSIPSCGLRYAVSYPMNADGYTEVSFQPYKVRQGVWQGVHYLSEHLLRTCTIPNVSATLIQKDLLQSVLTADITAFKLFGDWTAYAHLSLLTDIYYTTQTRNYNRQHNNNVRSSSFRQGNYYKESPLFRWYLAKYITEKAPAGKCKELLRQNKQLAFEERGMRGCELIRNHKLLKSIPFILQASLKPRPNLYYIKSAVYWLFHKPESVCSY